MFTIINEHKSLAMSFICWSQCCTRHYTVSSSVSVYLLIPCSLVVTRVSVLTSVIAVPSCTPTLSEPVQSPSTSLWSSQASKLSSLCFTVEPAFSLVKAGYLWLAAGQQPPKCSHDKTHSTLPIATTSPCTVMSHSGWAVMIREEETHTFIYSI